MSEWLKAKEIRTEEESKAKEERPKPRRTTLKRKEMVKVKVITRAEETALVQWFDGAAHRAYVPTVEVRGSQVAADTLKAGIPYGAPWEEIIKAMLATADTSPEAYAASLRKHSIWTSEDVEKNSRAAKRAIDAVAGIKIGELLQRARSLEKRAGG